MANEESAFTTKADCITASLRNTVEISYGNVSNYNGVTVFSFRTPSKKRTDYVLEIQVQNVTGKPHGQGKKKRKH